MNVEGPGNRPGARSSRRVFLWQLWGRDTVRDGVLLLLGFPLLASGLMLPISAASGGTWRAMLPIMGVLAVSFLLARWGLGRWVAAGQALAGKSPAQVGSDQ